MPHWRETSKNGGNPPKIKEAYNMADSIGTLLCFSSFSTLMNIKVEILEKYGDSVRVELSADELEVSKEDVIVAKPRVNEHLDDEILRTLFSCFNALV